MKAQTNASQPADQEDYKHLQIHKRIDLRTATDNSWKLIAGFPKPASAEDLSIFVTNKELTVGESAKAMVYKYMTAQRDRTIVQVFTTSHKYLGGGEYDTLTSEANVLSDAEMRELNQVANF